ncbi:MAG: glycosyltransferase family 39 protein [Candidatus Omnitrophota bacterium]
MKESIFKDKVFWLLLIFASIYILGNIGTGSLSTWDEAIYANISTNMLNGGNWVKLHYINDPWFDKPPLYMWATTCFYKIFGRTEFSTRLTSGLFGIAAIMLVYIFIKMFGAARSAIIAPLLLLATPHFEHFSKAGTMDVAMAFFILLMIYFFWKGENNHKYLFYSGAVLGLAYLMKGFAAFLGPIIIFLYCIVSGNWRYLFKKHFIAGILVGFAIIFGWHLLQYIYIGPQAIKEYFGLHIFQRAAHGIQEHTGGLNFYQKAIFNKNKPWSILMYLSVFYVLWQAIRHKDKKALLLCCWITATYVLYTAVKTKLHWYIMPIYPALALSSALFVERFFKGMAFRILLAVILIGMVIQVPISWAFKLDFNPEVKEVSGYARKLHLKGEKVYLYGISYCETFYCDFAEILSRQSYDRIVNEGIHDAYCVMQPRFLEETSLTYNFDYAPISVSDRIALYKIKFK